MTMVFTFLIQYATQSMFLQMSQPLITHCVNKIERFSTCNIIASASKAFGVLCGNLTSCNPHIAIRKFVPLCARYILSELDIGAAGVPGSPISGGKSVQTTTHPFGFATMSDYTIHWFQCILYNVVSQCGGKEIIHSNIRSILEDVLEKSISSCNSWRGYKWSARLLKEICKSLTTTYPLNYSSFNSDQLGDLGIFGFN